MNPRRSHLSRWAVLFACLVAVAACMSHRTMHLPANDSRSIVPAALVQPTLMPVSGKSAGKAKIAESYGRLPLFFEANEGQSDKQVKFISRGRGYTLFLTGSEAVLSLPQAEKESVMRMKLVGANSSARVSGVEELPGKSNYFIGNDPTQWRTNVPNFSKVKYQETYPGVDLVFYGNPQNLEYDFVLAPGADPHAITLDVSLNDVSVDPPQPGQTRSTAQAPVLRIDNHGDLVFNTKGEDLRFKKPVVYQSAVYGNETTSSDKTPVDGHWVLKGKNQVGFEVAAYDASKPLIIDPALCYATYLGGSSGDVAQAVAVDSSGSMYVTGQTTSTNFPTQNPIQAANAGHGDAFVTKLNATGTALVYSTYLGGIGVDGGYGIAVDSAGNAYVGGDTGSRNFPVTTGAFQTKCGNNCAGGLSDVFVSVLNPSGSALVYSTYLGGSSTDRLIEGITVDSSGDAFVTGWTQSTDFPVTAGAFQTTLHGSTSGFVTEINPTGTALVYSTYLGGSNQGVVSAIALDSSGDAYLTGWTNSSDFPTTAGAFQTSLGGGTDTYVAKLNPTGTSLLYSTYLGGSKAEIAYAIAVNNSGNAYVSGYTCSSNFPITTGALKTTYSSSSCTTWGGNGFVTELSADGSSLVYSTYLGGSGNEVAFGLALDSSGVVHLTGRTNSSNFPATPGAFQPKYAGSIDAFYAELNPSGTALNYSTFLGGSQSDAGYVIALDPAGNSYVGGRTYSNNFPVTPGAFQTTIPAAFGAMLFKISPGDQIWPLALDFGNQGIGIASPPLVTTFTNSESAPLSISGISFSGTNATDYTETDNCGTSLAAGASCTINVVFTPAAGGSRTATMLITDSGANSPQSVALSGNGSFVAVSPTALTFATQVINTQSASQPVSLINAGSIAINIANIATSGSYSQTNNCVSPLAANSSCTINVVFQPTASGTQRGTLTVTDDAGTQTATLTGVGTVISLSPTSLTFAPQTVKTSSPPQTITLTNVSVSAVTINKISVTGLRATSFSQTNNCPISPATLAGGANCTINVIFTPQLKGALSANVTVADTGGGSPQVVPLSGTGQ
jgi:Beta-propeller repeat